MNLRRRDRKFPEWCGEASRWLAVLICIATGFASIPAACAGNASELLQVPPEQAGMDARHLEQIDDEVARAIRRNEMPGCVVAIGRYGKLAWLKAYGNRQLEPEPEAMTVDTLFDLASLTKPIATATSIMILVDRGKLRIHDRVAGYLPEFGEKGKQSITVYHLLTHTSGLVADNPLADYRQGPEEAWKKICELELVAAPGTRFIYSDVGFIVLGKLIEKISGVPLDQFARREIFEPLGMKDTGFCPPASLRARAAPTEKREGRWLRGEVHDPRAAALGGVAGHAGLFSTATDLAQYARMMCRRNPSQEHSVLSALGRAVMTSDYATPGGIRGLGWDKRSTYSSNRGEYFSSSAFGHGGFTGTALWIDPELELFVIFLSNRLHPDGRGAVNSLAGRIGTIAAAAIRDRVVPVTSEPLRRAPAPVRVGIDVLRAQEFRLLAGQRVGLISNPTGISSDGQSTVELLYHAPGVKLVALFSPEHGWSAQLDTPRVADTKDPLTGLPVYSLYGDARKPSSEVLEKLDTLVFDIQDIGCRFYTYISTMGLALEAAAEQKKRFVVLDRPNPINGVDVSGPLLDAGRESFVGFHRIPIRHGMTAGELARMIAAERGWDVELHIVPLENWDRRDYFDATGLPWINPSPNMRSLNAATLYPGIGLLETTNLSVGRGTDTPFEIVGAPWIEPVSWAKHLNSLPEGQAENKPVVRFVPVWFTPSSSVYSGQRCGGVRIVILDRYRLDPVRLGLAIARQLRLDYPDQWNIDGLDRLLRNAGVLEQLRHGVSVHQIEQSYASELQAFLERRRTFLLYGDPLR
ncbi:MAG: hypothetical protein KatS3mg110_2912 [Pirellulaceae bacterium]|nr:MAG: hypothetical protein KatS3mg110_2912 [Pirellulaceae bacterium]